MHIGRGASLPKQRIALKPQVLARKLWLPMNDFRYCRSPVPRCDTQYRKVRAATALRPVRAFGRDPEAPGLRSGMVKEFAISLAACKRRQRSRPATRSTAIPDGHETTGTAGNACGIRPAVGM
jgi:hypothetical protein